MNVHLLKFNLLIILIIMLNACSEPVTYAPVKVVNQALPPDNGYVPQTLPGSTEGFADQQENPQALKQINQPEQTLMPQQTAGPALRPTTPSDRAGANDAPNAQWTVKAAKQEPKPQSYLARSTKKPVKMPTGPQSQKTILSASKNTNLKSGLSDTIHAPKEIKNGVKNAQKNNNSLYKSIAKENNRDTGAKKHIKTLDKPEISEKNSKNLGFSIDNKKILKLNFQWPLRGRISRSFSQTDNKGIEIIGKIGQTVHAAEAGKAVYCGNGLAGFGNLAIIKHNDAYLSAYANNSKLIVKEGQHVGKGQAIGQLGQTGLNKAALHFEIRKNGKPINPLAVLPQN